MRLAESGPHEQRCDPSAEGLWEMLDCQLPIPAAHAALLPTGKVLFLPGGRRHNGAHRAPRACLWDCKSAHFKTWDLAADFSLGGHCFLSDGRLVVVGGTRQQGTIQLKETFLFDPLTEEWLRLTDIPSRGACPTLLEVADGRILAVGGAGSSWVHEHELADGWRVAAYPGLAWPLYPQLILLADGSLFYSGQHFGGNGALCPGLLHSGYSFAEISGTSLPPDLLFGYRAQGGTILLPPAQQQRVMVFGGGSPPKRDVYVADFSGPRPIFGAAEPMNLPRANFNAVVLPDRTVLVCGGVRSEHEERPHALEADLFDPSDGAWAPAGVARVPRQEHSTAILLPDGRVLTAGSTNRSGQGELRLELYHPPYLFRGNRPIVESAPLGIKFGEMFSVKTPDSDIRWISLVKPMAVSHSFDSGQRLVDLPFESRGSGTLEAIVPRNADIAPPGRYLLFLVNHKGTPSEGCWIHLTHASNSTTPVDLTRQDARTNGKHAWQDRGRHSWNGSDNGPVTVQGHSIRPEAPDEEEQAPFPKTPLPAIGKLDRFATEEPNETASMTPSPPGSDGDRLAPLSVVPSIPDPGSDPIEEREERADHREHWELGDPDASSVPSVSTVDWYKWARPALILGSASLLALSMVVQIRPLRAAAAFVFLLFAPGMALVGLYRPSGWESQVALAVGLSVALETILTVVMLYLGTWSADRTFLILVIVSLSGAVIQLFKAAFATAGGTKRLKEQATA